MQGHGVEVEDGSKRRVALEIALNRRVPGVFVLVAQGQVCTTAQGTASPAWVQAHRKRVAVA